MKLLISILLFVCSLSIFSETNSIIFIPDSLEAFNYYEEDYFLNTALNIDRNSNYTCIVPSIVNRFIDRIKNSLMEPYSWDIEYITKHFNPDYIILYSPIRNNNINFVIIKVSNQSFKFDLEITPYNITENPSNSAKKIINFIRNRETDFRVENLIASYFTLPIETQINNKIFSSINNKNYYRHIPETNFLYFKRSYGGLYFGINLMGQLTFSNDLFTNSNMFNIETNSSLNFNFRGNINLLTDENFIYQNDELKTFENIFTGGLIYGIIKAICHYIILNYNNIDFFSNWHIYTYPLLFYILQGANNSPFTYSYSYSLGTTIFWTILSEVLQIVKNGFMFYYGAYHIFDPLSYSFKFFSLLYSNISFSFFYDSHFFPIKSNHNNLHIFETIHTYGMENIEFNNLFKNIQLGIYTKRRIIDYLHYNNIMYNFVFYHNVKYIYEDINYYFSISTNILKPIIFSYHIGGLNSKYYKNDFSHYFSIAFEKKEIQILFYLNSEGRSYDIDEIPNIYFTPNTDTITNPNIALGYQNLYTGINLSYYIIDNLTFSLNFNYNIYNMLIYKINNTTSNIEKIIENINSKSFQVNFSLSFFI